MTDRRRLGIDRRSGKERRKAYRLGYFMEGGVERRSGKDRRFGGERRRDWMRVNGVSVRVEKKASGRKRFH